MKPVDLNEVNTYVAENIGTFHKRRLESLNALQLNNILKRKNPYLFKAKNIDTAASLVQSLLNAHLSSQEETIFGEFLEGLAVFVCSSIFGGKKSAAEGIDLEFESDSVRYIVAIKSGPNWGNSSQIKRMVDNFKQAKRILRTQGTNMQIVAVNGCCYGKENKPDKGDYFKYCGQTFWQFISGNEKLYLDIIEPLGHQAKQKNEVFIKEYGKLINRFTYEFTKEFCTHDYAINWEELVSFNSGRSQ